MSKNLGYLIGTAIFAAIFISGIACASGTETPLSEGSSTIPAPQTLSNN